MVRSLDTLDQTGALTLDLLGLFGVTPDFGLGQALFDLVETQLVAVDIKDTSARCRPFRRALRVDRSVPGYRWWPPRDSLAPASASVIDGR